MSDEKRKELEESLSDEEKDEDEIMDTVHASATEVVAKGKDVEDLAKKAVAKKLTEEEKRKLLEDNVLGQFYD